MPPKKKTDTTEATAGGETVCDYCNISLATTYTDTAQKFSWTPENDRALLILALGRNVGPADYEKFVSALPAGANFQGVRQRISKLRGEQKQKYEDMGWELTAEASTKPKAPAKRKATSTEGEDSSGGKDTEGVKVKKPRAKKGEGKKGKKAEEKDVEEEEDAAEVKSEEGAKEENEEEFV